MANLSQKIKLIILAIVAVILAAAGYFCSFPKAGWLATAKSAS